MTTVPATNRDHVVVLVGLRLEIVAQAADALQAALAPKSGRSPGFRVHAADSLDSVLKHLESGPVGTVITGAGLPLRTRLALVEAVFTHSTATTVHLKDTDAGPQGLLPFAHGILVGLTTPGQ